jgi:hypothetical protein
MSFQWSYEGFKGSVRFISASSPSRCGVRYKQTTGLAHATLFFSSPLSSLFSTLTLQKIKASIHFVISWHLVHVLLITICLVKMIHELEFFFFFQFHPFFYLSYLVPNILIDIFFYLIWFLKVSFKKKFHHFKVFFPTNLILVILVDIYFPWWFF